MKNRWKGHLGMVIVALFVAAPVTMMICQNDTCEVQAAVAEMQVQNMSELQTAVEECNKGAIVEVKLLGDISGISSEIELSDGELTIDLNGHAISGNPGTEKFIFNASGKSKLTVKDSSSEKKGKIENTDKMGGAIRKAGGALQISAGTFVGGFRCISASDSAVTIEGGIFTANEAGKACYVCEIEGTQSSLNISEGTFNLNAKEGCSLVIGSDLNEVNVTITGGTFNGRIARMTEDASRVNYTAFYGDEYGNCGILGDGYVLTDNAFSYQGNNTVFSASKVSVVKGILVKFNTKRSTLEEYSIAETDAAKQADYYSLVPVSVGLDRTIYSNSNSSVQPTTDTSRVTDGNTYEFCGWYGENGNEYASINDYIAGQGELSSDSVLSANWNAKVHTSAGLEKAIKNSQAVKNIELTDNLSLTSSMVEEQAGFPLKRSLNLGGKSVSYDIVGASNPAFVLNSSWEIKNGTIESSRQACIQIEGTAVIENLNCKTRDFSYVVGFSNVTGSSSNRIISGTFETTSLDGYALWTTSGTGMGVAEDVTNLFKASNTSSRDTKINGSNVYLNAPKLIVSQSPITYLENTADVNMGSIVYGENIAAVNQTVNNQGYIGDIVVTGVSVDNPVFTVTGENAKKTLVGGSAELYSYALGIAGNPMPGAHEGTVSINYIKMDGTAGVCRQKVTLTVTARQLSIAEPALTKTKTYDGKTTAKITAGALSGVIAGDDVSVTAAAKYNSASAGSNKTISVSYTLSGADKDKYLVPTGKEYTGGVINKATGKASVSIADYHVGEKVKVKISSSTNGTKSVKFYFKKKGEADSTYSTSVPGKEGSYTIKAVFAATSNYKAAEATANFKVSYIATPKQPYTLKGTKGKNGWYTSSVTVQPAKGYSISTKQSGTYKSSYTIDSTMEPVIYLKNENGAVTKGISVGKLQIDKTLPQISGIKNGDTHYDDNLKAVVSDSNLASVTLNGKSVSFEGQSVSVSLKPSETKYTIVAEDKAGNKVTYTAQVEESWLREGIVSDGKKKLVKKKSYKLGSGQWKVSGDNTVYSGNMNFYVSSDGEYDFKKQ